MMKIINTFLFLCITLASWAQETNVSLMTYNIRLDVASDGENAWPNRKDYLINQIKFHEPSIFGIQEGLPHQFAYMKQSLPDYSALGVGRYGGDKGEYSALFYDNKRFEVLESNTFWLSLTPDSPSKDWDAALPRICTYALFKENKTGENFWVFNTHFDHIGVQARLHSIDVIMEKIKSLNSDEFPVVFMGDLNLEPSSDVIAKLNNYMIDTFAASKKAPFGATGTFNGFKFNKAVTRRIDYIYVSKHPGITVNKYAVLTDSKDLKYPSDHLPVYSEITLKGGK